jgi:hypothetical protein
MNEQLVRLRNAIKRLSTDQHLFADALFATLVGVVVIAEALTRLRRVFRVVPGEGVRG